MHSWPPVLWCDDVCMHAPMCAYVYDVFVCMHVLMCFQAESSSSGNVCRVLTLLPKIILFLLALLTPLVLVFLKENKNEILVCIYRFAVCVCEIYINNTLWNRNTQCPAVFLAFGPFSSTVPYFPCSDNFPTTLPFYRTFQIQSNCIILTLYWLEPLFHLVKVADALAPSIPRGPSSPPLAPDGLVSVGVVLLLLTWEASQPRAQKHGGRSTCASAVVGPADFTLAWGQSGERKADKDEYDLEAWLHLPVCALWTANNNAVSSLAQNNAMGMKDGRTAVCISTGLMSARRTGESLCPSMHVHTHGCSKGRMTTTRTWEMMTFVLTFVPDLHYMHVKA